MAVVTSTLKGRQVSHFDSCEFTKGERRFRIIATTTTGPGVYDCIDTVKNDRGEYKDFTRTELITFINQ